MKHITTIIALLILCFANVQAQKILKPKWSTPHVGTAAHFNNSGTKLLTRGGNSIDVWDNKADTLLYSFTNPSQITNAKFSNDDSKIVASTATGPVFILDSETGKIIYELKDGYLRYDYVQFSKNKDLVLAASAHGTICVWSVITGELVTKISISGITIRGSSFSNNGLFVLIHYKNNAEIFDSQTGESIKILNHSGDVFTSQFDNNDERIITTISGDKIKIWGAESGHEVYTLTDTSVIHSAEFSADGKNFLYKSDGKIEVRKTLTGEKIRTFIDKEPILNAHFNKSGEYIVSCTLYGTAKLWNVKTGELSHVFQLRSLHHTNDCEFESSGKRFLVTSNVGIVTICDTITKEISTEHIGYSGRSSFPEFGTSGKKIFTGSEDGSVKVWNTENGKLELLDFHHRPLDDKEYIPFCSNNTFISMSNYGQVRVRDMNTLEILHDELPAKFVLTKFLPTCKQIIYLDNKLSNYQVIKVYDIVNDSVTKTFSAKETYFYPFCVNTSSTFLTSRHNSSIAIWSLQSDSIVHSIKMTTSYFNIMGFANDTTLIVRTSFPNELFWIDIGQEKITRKYALPETLYLSELIKDETRLLAISNKSIMLYDPRTGELLKNISVEKKVSMADFSNDEKLMITAVDGEISIYNTVTMEKIARSEGFGTIVYAKFNETADRIVTADKDGTVRVWNTDFLEQSTGIGEFKSVQEITLTPNPATDEITIKGISSNSPITYTFTDIIGTVITHGTISEQTSTYTLSTRNLPSGFYNITFQMNGTSHTEKFGIVH